MFTRAELKEQARAQMAGKVWPIIGIMFLAGIILMCASMLNAVPFIGALAVYFINAAITVGIRGMFMNITYGDEPKVQDIFSAFPRILPATLLFFLISLFSGLWSLLFVIPGIVMGIAYSMSFNIFLENPDMGAMECIRESKSIMSGHKMEYFVLQLSFIPWWLLCMVTCGLASYYVVPYVTLTNIDFYHRIKNVYNAEPVYTEVPVMEEPAAEAFEEAPVYDTGDGTQFADVNNNEFFDDPFAQS